MNQAIAPHDGCTGLEPSRPEATVLSVVLSPAVGASGGGEQSGDASAEAPTAVYGVMQYLEGEHLYLYLQRRDRIAGLCRLNRCYHSLVRVIEGFE